METQQQRDIRAVSDAQDDDIDAQADIEPYDGCPHCGGMMSQSIIAIDEAHDEVYYGKKCDSCGYTEED